MRLYPIIALAIALAVFACSDSSTGTRAQPPLVDDRLIAFVSDSGNVCCGGRSSIFIRHADGSHTSRLTDEGHRDDEPSWSRDGSTIAFFSDRAPAGVWLVDANGSNLRPFLHAPEFVEPAELSWSPNGHSIAFDDYTTDSLDNVWDVIEIADPDGTNAHQLITRVLNAATPTWSPDGTRIAYAGDPLGPHIFVIRTDGTAEHQITTGIDFQPQWSPVGGRIAFTSLDTNYVDFLAHIVVTNEDGSDRHALTSGRVDRQPSWSPDGRQIAFASFDRDTTTGQTLTAERIYRMNADGSNRRPISSDSGGPLPSFKSWSPAWKPTP